MSMENNEKIAAMHEWKFFLHDNVMHDNFVM